MMLLNKDKPVVSVSALIHNTGPGGPQRTSWPGPLWSEHPTQHAGGVGVSGVTGMSGGGGSVGRHSPPLTPMEGLSTVPSVSSGGNFGGTSVSSNGPASPGLSGASFTLGSPCSSSGSFGNNSGGDIGPYPPKHPLYGSKNLCAICEDKASGKHYGVFSCEGCKGFFKRTVRKELTYNCREIRQCTIDKRHRNRCQHCRYNKCLSMGMKREAVQEERQRNKRSSGAGAEADVKEAVGEGGVVGSVLSMPIESIKEAEMAAEVTEDKKPLILKDGVPVMLGFAASTQLDQLVVWAKHIPHFRSLPINDQMLLLKNGWNELLITAFSHRSIDCTNAIRLSDGVTVDRYNAEQIGVDKIFDRVLTELVAKMRDMKMDKVELGCLRTIVLYNPDVKGLSCPEHIDSLRERVYSTLEEYTKQMWPGESGRFPKLLLRLPALRSIGLQCLDHLFYFMMFVGTDALPMADYLTSKLQIEELGALSP